MPGWILQLQGQILPEQQSPLKYNGFVKQQEIDCAQKQGRHMLERVQVSTHMSMLLDCQTQLIKTHGAPEELLTEPPPSVSLQ